VLKFAEGTRSLVEAMIEDSGADVRTSSPARRIEQDEAGVMVRTPTGDAFAASTAVVALPLNVLKHLDFSPQLGKEKSIASEEGHAGRSVKVWALVEGAPPFFVGVGRGPKGLKSEKVPDPPAKLVGPLKLTGAARAGDAPTRGLPSAKSSASAPTLTARARHPSHQRSAIVCIFIALPLASIIVLFSFLKAEVSTHKENYGAR
jgi:hypothetical protein